MSDPVQIWIIGLAATILAAIFRFIVAKRGKEIGKGWMTAIVAVVSFGLALAFNIPDLPVYVDPLQYLGDLGALLSVYVGTATVIYNILLDRVLDAVNLNVERFLS